MSIRSRRTTHAALPPAVVARPRMSARVGTALAIIGAALALRLYRLGAQSLWLDEGGTWAEVTGRGWGALFADLSSKDAAYPLYHLLLKGWIVIAGDSESALRMPSALAGVLAVAALMLAAAELHGGRFPLVAGVLVATSPFAIWHAQDAKAYSLLMFVIALLLWCSMRALRKNHGRDWFVVATLAMISLFVHRLALLPLAALLFALALAWPLAAAFANPRTAITARITLGALAISAAVVAVVGLARSIGGNGWQRAGHVAAGPVQSLWLTLSYFALDRGDIGGTFGLPLVAWAAPALALTLWGLALLLRDATRGQSGAIIIVCMFAIPLLLLAFALVFTPVYEARYATVAFPAWVLVAAYPFARNDRRPTTDDRPHGAVTQLPAVIAIALVISTLTVNLVVLFQPKHGLFSGAAVKEQWREGVQAIASVAHPDDLLILHPYYTLPMWQYYAPRVTPDPLPQPVLFSGFGQGSCVERFHDDPNQIRTCFKDNYENPFNKAARGKKRALLLIAPEHAATIDPPKTLADLQADYKAGYIKMPTGADDYGWVGLRFQHAKEEQTWPCGGATFVGIETMCVSYPASYDAGGHGTAPAPATPLAADFGGVLHLRGYSLALWGGKARPGGTLPITLYWQALTKPTHDYRMFLHLCRDCDMPPLAEHDRQPLDGYDPAGLTTTWIVGDPVHDERNLPLPTHLAPGRYTLLLGVYPSDNPAQAARLPVANTHARVIGGTRLVLGEVTISP